MTKRAWAWWLVVLVLLVGCGGGKSGRGPSGPVEAGGARSVDGSGSSEAAPRSFASAEKGDFAPPASEESEPAPAAPPPPPSAPSASGAAHAESRTADAARPSMAPPRERPGLGTEWGETRTSRVHDVSFVRADPGRPFAVAQLFYNDRRGVDAQVNFHGRNAEWRRTFGVAGGAISVALQDASGDPLETVNVGDRTYVVGEAGERYTIALTNHTGHRFEVVATVDGLDVINGRTGSLSNRGYLIMPYATLEIDGFRQSQDAVAAFRFASVADSYAAQVGKPRNVGVIGVAVFGERGDPFPGPWTDAEINRRETANPFPNDGRFARPPR